MADYYEIILEGDPEILKGFLVGYLSAAGITEEFFTAKESGVEHDSFLQELAEWARLSEERSHIVASRRVLNATKSAVARVGRDLNLEVAEVKPLKGARVSFEWEVYNRDQGAELRRLTEDHPATLVLDGYAPEEEVHEDHEGKVGMYAPSHPYILKARGNASGPAGEVIAWANRLRSNAFAKLDTIELEYLDE